MPAVEDEVQRMTTLNQCSASTSIHSLATALLTLASLALAACAAGPTPNAAPSTVASSAPTGPVATAVLLTAAGNSAGKVTVATVQAGVEISVEAQGLPPGAHGLHVHANGACTAGPDAATGKVVDFGAAGGHFDPGTSHNHGQPGQPVAEVHGGDIPSLQVGPDGRGTLRFVTNGLTVTPGRASVMGRSVVVHADADDYVSDPAGNSGARLLCGLLDPSDGGVVKGRATLEGSQVFPEGIALDTRTGQVFVGSSANGDIYRIPKGSEKAEVFQVGGAQGRQGAFGMKVDEQGRLWVAGGPNGTLALVDVAGATTLAVWKAPSSKVSFLNDLVLSRGYVYVTDSFNPVVYRVRNAPGTPAALEPWLDLSGTQVRYVPNEVNFNGIVASPDGRYLLAIQLVSGQLWRIDTQSRAVSEVRLEGPADLKNGDGLVLVGTSELHVVRNANNEIVRVRLDPTWTTGRIEQRVTDARLRYPTTAVAVPGGLMVVNGQLDKQKMPPPLLPFDVVTISPP